MNAEAAIIIVAVLIGQELLKLVTSFFFKKLAREDYMTKADCLKCTKDDDNSMRRLESDISTIKGLLLALAMNKDLTAEDLAKLMGGQQ